jgi:Ulp1 family protease
MSTDHHIPVAKVNGRNLTDADIRSLRPGEWLTDMVCIKCFNYLYIK